VGIAREEKAAYERSALTADRATVT
jgi:hypothetical protein